LVELAATHTVARMLERDDFRKRFDNERPIAIHEFLYPLIQGYDSVALEADVELGGTDQKFNLLMGRALQKHYGQVPQITLTMPILEGLDGVQKMSKSLNNCIGINDAPGVMYQKIVSMPDSLMWRYFELLSFESGERIAEYQAAVEQGDNPRDYKMKLAHELVSRFHSEEAALMAPKSVGNRIVDGQLPEGIPEIELPLQGQDGLPIAAVLNQAKLVKNSAAARDMLRQGAVKVDGTVVPEQGCVLAAGACVVVQAGKKKIAKIKVTTS